MLQPSISSRGNAGSRQSPGYEWALGLDWKSPNFRLPVQIVVVPQPASTSAAVIADAAPRLSTENITILSRLAQNRLTQQVGFHHCETLQ